MKLLISIHVIGVIVLALGVILLFSKDAIYRHILRKELVVSRDSNVYEMWRESPVPITMDVYLFNCTNTEQLEEKGFKPNLVELGPYRFKEHHEKVNITWNKNHTVTYQKKVTWYFDAENSNGSLKDVVTTLNPVTVGINYMVRHWPSFVTFSLSTTLKVVKQSIWTTKNVNEILFEGYSDHLLTIAAKVPGLSSMKVPYDKVGYFYGVNGTTKSDGIRNVDTGAGDISKVGLVHQWNYNNQTNYNIDKCNKVGGSSGDFFPPDLKRYGSVEMFAAHMCKSITLDYVDDTRVNNVLGYRYELSKNMFDNGTQNPANQCNCNGECLPQGVLNISACKYGAPAFISYPHFSKADPYYINKINGLKPDPEKHNLRLILEPKTGIPLDAKIQFQFNLLLLNNYKLSLFEKVPTILFPLMWFEERATIPPQFAESLKQLVNLPTVSLYCFEGLIILGAIIMVVPVLIGLYGRKQINGSERKLSEEKPETVRLHINGVKSEEMKEESEKKTFNGDKVLESET